MEENKMLEKIRALFRLADVARGASQAEAELAMEKAQLLMTKHGIKQIEVEQQGKDAREAKQFNVHQRTFKTGRQEHADDRFIARILRECFNVRIVWSSYHEVVPGWITDPWTKEKVPHKRVKSRLTYLIFGEPQDTEIAEMVIQELHEIMWRLYRAYLKDEGIAHNAVLYNSFFSGVKDGFIAAAHRGQNQAFREAGSAATDMYALVIVDKAKAIQAYITQTCPTSPRASRGIKIDNSSHAHASGYKAGGSIKVGQRKIQ
jgi:hypothetical protein